MKIIHISPVRIQMALIVSGAISAAISVLAEGRNFLALIAVGLAIIPIIRLINPRGYSSRIRLALSCLFAEIVSIIAWKKHWEVLFVFAAGYVLIGLVSYLKTRQMAQQQSVPLPAGTDPTTHLNLGGVSVKVDYTYGPMPHSLWEGGVDLTATPSGCGGCSWGQAVSRTGDGAMPLSKDGKENGPLYGQEGGPANQLKDRPASGNGAVGSFTAISVLGGVNGKTFSPKGAMTWGYSVDGKGGVTMMGPRVATASEFRQAVQVQ